MRCEECPPVSFQPGKQLCRHSSAADGGLSLGPPSRKPLKSLGRSSTLRPPLFPQPMMARSAQQARAAQPIAGWRARQGSNLQPPNSKSGIGLFLCVSTVQESAVFHRISVQSPGLGSRHSRSKGRHRTNHTCGSPLMKIDHYGEVLIGCVHCNYWGRPGDKRPIMEMLEDDLEALRASVRRKRH